MKDQHNKHLLQQVFALLYGAEKVLPECPSSAADLLAMVIEKLTEYNEAITQ